MCIRDSQYASRFSILLLKMLKWQSKRIQRIPTSLWLSTKSTVAIVSAVDCLCARKLLITGDLQIFLCERSFLLTMDVPKLVLLVCASVRCWFRVSLRRFYARVRSCFRCMSLTAIRLIHPKQVIMSAFVGWACSPQGGTVCPESLSRIFFKIIPILISFDASFLNVS